ncbi:thiol:disulfide interchange protein DsbA/DsbL [Vibrio sp. S9_S30]|uniref:thiol:disulfide interchange protein DsbA/DsbL n=1 Tax=Vibrio sp. S9_S30 TaxID=2720226 RepID=UPI001681B7D8|nr:thiol:disulfide interchange protein DsbA/DsbL [Vibrio sp. S9_S30]MBD1559734.1 thiol:disulfide interchange protein DsbA/DsbL [Vibrio sp. S9_S30]
MFKRFHSHIFLFFSAVMLVACTDDGIPTQGTHFELLPTTLSSDLVSPVTEVFSLNCGHCRSMEKFLPEIRSELPEEVGKVHVTFNENAQIGALIYYAAEMQLDTVPDHQMMEELFAAAQMGKEYSQDDIRQATEMVFTSRGLISPYRFDKEQQKSLFEHITIAETVTNQAQIHAVPTFIINGKYQVVTSGHKDIKDIAKTINYLLTL